MLKYYQTKQRRKEMAIKYIEKFPTADEFNSLTEAVGWGTRDRNVVEEAFKHSLYAISAYDDDKFIGFGRIQVMASI